MKNKKTILIVLAMLLVCVLSVAGTLAYLNEKTKTVTNSFVATTDLIDPKPTPIDPGDNPVGPSDDDNKGFYLTETEVKQDETTGEYKFTEAKTPTHGNEYKGVVPGMTIPKNPTVGVQIAEKMVGYVFIEVTPNEKLTYTIDATNWTKLDVTPKTEDAEVYVLTVGDGNKIYHMDTVVEYGILDGNEVTVKDFDGSLEDEDKDLGKLVFTAYACQAQSFESAADAWEKAFGA